MGMNTILFNEANVENYIAHFYYSQNEKYQGM